MSVHHLTRRVFVGLCAALPAAYAFRASAQSGKALTVGLSTYPPNFNPWSVAGGTKPIVSLAMNRGLLGYLADGSMRGELASEWTRVDDRTWDFELRDALFHDGSPVTSDDVRYSFEQVTMADSKAWLKRELSQIAAIETPDARTVRIVMSTPSVLVPIWLASVEMPIIKRDSVSAERVHGIGAGPFMLVSQETGVHVEMRAFDKYYREGEPRLDSLKFIVYPDESLRVAALEAGDVDVIDFVPPQAMKSLEESSSLKLDNSYGGQFMYLHFNGATKPLDDPRVRLAIAHSIRREEIIDAAFYGWGKVMEGAPFSAEGKFHSPDRASLLAYDPDKARQLLSAAGVGDGFSCSLLSSSQFSMHRDTALVVQQHLAEVGIKVTLVMPDWATRTSMADRGQFDIAVNGWILRYDDPDALSPIIDPSLPPGYQRSHGLTIPDVAELLAQGRVEFDQEKRRKIYADIEARILEYAPVVGLTWRVQGYGLKQNVESFKNFPGGLIFYTGTSLAETFFS